MAQVLVLVCEGADGLLDDLDDVNVADSSNGPHGFLRLKGQALQQALVGELVVICDVSVFGHGVDEL